MSSNENTIKSYASSPQSLISFMENSNDFWHIKDEQSRYIYINDSLLTALNTPKHFNVEGLTDKEMPVKPCQELWPEFLAYDQKTINENRTISAIEIHYYGKGNIDTPVARLAEKTPLYDENNNIIGTICHGRIIDSPELLYYMRRFNRKTIQFDAPNDVFSKRELEVIFWALQRLSSKEIAKRLTLSSRTVEGMLQSIYKKADVNSKMQLIEYCKYMDLDTYIPVDFVRKGVQLIE